MIVCGKCGFTQPKDVYCANCGVNLEKYKPEKPPKLVQLLKDPYFQISFSIIVAIAAFFIFINKPAPINTSDTDFPPDTEISEFLQTTNNEPQSDDDQLSSVKAKEPDSNKQPKPSKKAESKKIKSETKIVVPKAAEPKLQNKTQADTMPLANTGVTKATYSFYELLPSQAENYFTGSSKVEASVLPNDQLNIQNLSSSKLAIDSSWDLTKNKSNQLDYMVESLEDGELKGIKFILSKRGTNINIRVNANIPNSSGSASSIDWSRSLKIEKNNTILLKIQLPHNELSASFLEDSYNSPLSIMGSSLFLEQKTLLLAVISFE